MTKFKPKFLRVQNPLRSTLDGPRKIDREAAVTQARRHVEALRDEFTQGLVVEIAKLEALGDPLTGRLSDADIKSGIALTPVIWNLAGAYDFPLLQTVAASLHDLLVVMQEKHITNMEPVMVHVHAARLAGPGKPPVPADEATKLLDQLKRIVARYRDGQRPMSKDASAPDVAAKV